jgi:hypothetical protein
MVNYMKMEVNNVKCVRCGKKEDITDENYIIIDYKGEPVHKICKSMILFMEIKGETK